MNRYGMAVAAMCLTILGPVLASPHLGEWPVRELLLVLPMWVALELYIGLRRPFQGHVPAHWIVRGSRLLWLVSAAYSWLDVRYGWTRVELPLAVTLAMLLLVLIGLVIRTWAVVHLGRSFTYDVQRPAEGEVVCTGPYRWIRHPSYLGMCLVASLPGFVLGSLLGGIGLMLATIPQTIFRLCAEERMMENEFGEVFRVYQRRSYRLLPFVY